MEGRYFGQQAHFREPALDDRINGLGLVNGRARHDDWTMGRRQQDVLTART